MGHEHIDTCKMKRSMNNSQNMISFCNDSGSTYEYETSLCLYF